MTCYEYLYHASFIDKGRKIVEESIPSKRRAGKVFPHLFLSDYLLSIYSCSPTPIHHGKEGLKGESVNFVIHKILSSPPRFLMGTAFWFISLLYPILLEEE
jgi:hypothetical protein